MGNEIAKMNYKTGYEGRIYSYLLLGSSLSEKELLDGWASLMQRSPESLYNLSDSEKYQLWKDFTNEYTYS